MTFEDRFKYFDLCLVLIFPFFSFTTFAEDIDWSLAFQSCDQNCPAVFDSFVTRGPLENLEAILKDLQINDSPKAKRIIDLIAERDFVSDFLNADQNSQQSILLLVSSFLLCWTNPENANDAALRERVQNRFREIPIPHLFRDRFGSLVRQKFGSPALLFVLTQMQRADLSPSLYLDASIRESLMRKLLSKMKSESHGASSPELETLEVAYATTPFVANREIYSALELWLSTTIPNDSRKAFQLLSFGSISFDGTQLRTIFVPTIRRDSSEGHFALLNFLGKQKTENRLAHLNLSNADLEDFYRQALSALPVRDHSSDFIEFEETVPDMMPPS